MNNVGIVVLSHSRELVRGLKKLLLQIESNVRLAIAGGFDDDGMGTDFQDIKAAIESVYSINGVVILFDLGSALFNAEIAIEMMDNKKKIVIADAPLVEGAYAAIIESGCGSKLEQVLAAAEGTKLLNKIVK